MALNVVLLKKIKKHILAYPRAFDMSDWGRSAPINQATPCGTVACIAGWACYLSPKAKTIKAGFEIKEPWTAQGAARNLLGLQSEVASCLFNAFTWPPDLYAAYDVARSYKKRSEIAACVIDRLINNKGKSL